MLMESCVEWKPFLGHLHIQRSGYSAPKAIAGESHFLWQVLIAEESYFCASPYLDGNTYVSSLDCGINNSVSNPDLYRPTDVSIVLLLAAMCGV